MKENSENKDAKKIEDSIERDDIIKENKVIKKDISKDTTEKKGMNIEDLDEMFNITPEKKKKIKDINDYFSKEYATPVWNPQIGNVIAGTIVEVKDFPERYGGSILITIEQAHDKGKISWWLTTVAKSKIADMSHYIYQRDNFMSIVTAIKMMIGKGIAIRYEGMCDGANYSYKNFTVVRAPDFDRDMGSASVIIKDSFD